MQNDKRYILQNSNPPAAYRIAFEEPLYYQKGYLEIQDHPQVHSLYLLDTLEELIVGKAIFTVEPGSELVSISRAPFGSFVIARELDSNIIEHWLNEVITPKMIVKHPSFIYPNYASETLGKKASSVVMDLNHHIDLTDYSLRNLHNMQMRRIRKCKNAGYQFQSVTGDAAIAETHEFLTKCRKEQGLQINISASKLLRSFNALPSNYHAFQVRTRSGELIAATIALKVTNEIIYNYLPGSLKSFNKYSPMSFLLFRMALSYQEKSFRLLDLGVSSVDGKEQESLAIFKQRMGAKRSDKPIYYF